LRNFYTVPAYLQDRVVFAYGSLPPCYQHFFANVPNDPDVHRHSIGVILSTEAECAFSILRIREGGFEMNWDEVTGKWNQLKGSVKERWGKLTDDDLTMIDGKRDRMVGKIQERYGITKEKAEEQIRDWNSTARNEKETARRKAS
jgi:uncharacterized protein YjbJ (UPF0337 family)